MRIGIYALIAAGLCFVMPPAFAQAADGGAPREVLAQLSADLNGDGTKDRIVLLHDRDGDKAQDVDLAIYLSANGALPAQPTLLKTAFGWTSDMATPPSLMLSHAGSLLVIFQNDAVGSDRWQQQYTIAFRGGVLVVAGYSYQDRDTLSANSGQSCDVNYLAGKGMRNGKPIDVKAHALPLAEWSNASIPAACTF